MEREHTEDRAVEHELHPDVESAVIRCRAFSRAGLLGNPSDGYGGKTISLTVRNFFAEVSLAPQANGVSVLPSHDDQPNFDSVYQLIDRVERLGYYGGVRLLLAAIKAFSIYADRFHQTALDRGFRLAYRTNIPQSVGLAGSSAIVVAALRALSQHFYVSLEPHLLASLALSVERDELKIPAGLQDRVIQSLEGLVYMDFSRIQVMNGLPCGHYERLDPESLPPLYVAYGARAAEPTETLHGDLRQRFEQGEKRVLAAMQQFAEIAEQGKQAIAQRDVATLHRLIDANFDLRNSICDLNPAHRQMVEAARACGASAKYCGSGGAIIGTYTDPEVWARLVPSLERIGCQVVRPIVI